KGFEDYHFYWRNAQQSEHEEELSEETTNEEGITVPNLGLERFSANAYQLEILAKVFEAESGRNVAAESRLLVSEEDYLLGVKVQDSLSYINKNAVRKVHWIAITPQLVPQAVEGLIYELAEVRYVSVLVKQNDGTYRYESRRKDRVVESSLIALTEGGFEQTLKTEEPGEFIVYIKKDAEVVLNQLSYSVAGSGNVARSLDRNAELQINLNKEVYAPGDEIEVSIRAPYTGSGLMTIEKDKVYSHIWFRTDTTSSVQRIRIPEGIEGNAYINVQFVRDSNSEEIFMSPLSYGVKPFQISLDQRRIQVSLKTPEVILPGEKLPLTIHLNRPGRIVVYGVDQGILQVARYKTPRPLEHFFQKRALEVTSSQILDLILPEFSMLMRASAAGGDQEGALASHLNPFKRKNKPPVVWWSGIVSLPEGESTMEWVVPDYFNGKLHLFAMAVDEQHIGMTETYTDVRSPIVLTPNVPAFVAPGDRLRVTTGAFSNLDEQTQVKLMLETDGAFKLPEQEVQALDLAAQREVTAGFEITALGVLGSSELTFIAELPDGQRITMKETISVRPATEHRVT
ncbi:MAG: alpha-2-macroglobulin family protein, partial [Saezia sp.]